MNKNRKNEERKRNYENKNNEKVFIKGISGYF